MPNITRWIIAVCASSFPLTMEKAQGNSLHYTLMFLDGCKWYKSNKIRHSSIFCLFSESKTVRPSRTETKRGNKAKPLEVPTQS